jgi:hypothetical protein
MALRRRSGDFVVTGTLNYFDGPGAAKSVKRPENGAYRRSAAINAACEA